MKVGVGAFRARLRWNQDVIDVAVAVTLATFVLAVAGLRVVGASAGAVGAGPLTPVSAVLILAQTLPLAVRRRRPVLVLAVTGAAIATGSSGCATAPSGTPGRSGRPRSA